MTRNMNTRRLLWLLLAAGLALILIWSGLKAWRTYRAAQSLLDRQAAAEELLAGGLSNADPEAAEDLVYGVRGDIVTLRNEVAFLMPLMPYLGWLPRVGPLAVASPELLEMADAGSEAAAYAFRGLKPALVLLQDDGGAAASRIPALLDVIATAEVDLAQASRAMDRAVAARAAVENVDALPWRVRTLLQQADEWLPVGQDGLKMALVLPEMLGHEAPRRYLIIAQNADELRATGGFISGAGYLEVDNGAIVNLAFLDANQVDAWLDSNETYGGLTKPYDPPPQPLQTFMLLDMFLFRDANFWPDFPRSAQQAMDLYSYGQDVPPLDGAIAVDQEFLRRLVAATGPVSIPDTGEQITSNNLVVSLQGAWTLQEGVQERKSFLSTFSTAIRDRIEQDFARVDALALARNLVTALQEKHLQLYVRDPELEATLDELDWAGHLPAPNNEDFLMVVDTNVGYNKANLFIDRSVDYAVTLTPEGTAVADLTITHIHTGADDGEPCYQGTLQEYEARAPYRELAEKCYWNYLRVYVPAGSELLSGPEHVVPAATWYGRRDWDEPTQVGNESPGLTTFSNFMLVPKASQVESRYRYQLPAVTQTADGATVYRLRVNKQAGTSPYPLQVTVSLPEGAQLQDATPQPTRVDGRTIHFESTPASDSEFTITYR